MGTFSGASLINELARRLRDTLNTGYSRVLVLNIINRVQDSVNVRLGLVYGTATFATTGTAFYSTSAIASNYAYPVAIRDEQQREIDMVPFSKLAAQDPEWVRRFGDRPEMFAPLGRELLVISPIPQKAQTLTLVYVKHPTALADAGAPLWDLPDEHKPLVLDLAESVLLFRSREFKAMQEALGRAAPKLLLEDAAQILRRGTVGERLKLNPKAADLGSGGSS